MTLVDGVAVDTLPADDRGLSYGDGLFESIAVRAGRALRLDYHLERLAAGATRLDIEMPADEVLASEIGGIAEGHLRAVVKLILTRGSGGRGYRPDGQARTRRIVSLHDWPELQPGPVALRVCSTRLARNPALAGIKHLNRLEQVLARAEWHDDTRFQEGLMLDTAGEVVECTSSNVFMLREGTLETPAVDQAGVAGVVRRILLERAEEAGLAVSVRRMSLDALLSADEVLISNSIAGLRAVNRIDDRTIPVGPYAARLASLLEV